ncbi:MAG: hypothetical protein ABSE00_09085 [Chitinispirillaceae bacterium]|jgi:hypothetical protein
MKKPLLFTLLLCIQSTLFAEEKVDENALFADSSSVIDSAKIVNTQAAKTGAEEKNSVAFSGAVYAYADPSLSRSWFDNPDLHLVTFDTRIVGNGFIDARLLGGAKAYADLQGSYVPTPSYASLDPGNFGKPDSGLVFDIPEMFVDANINKVVYLRMGRQVLQWGPCNLWNPTDLVNVENKTFLTKEGQRDGTYGLKIHIPYKTLFNFYSFIDANDAPIIDSLAVAAKAEFLIGRTEMALSGWGKDGQKPVEGFDFTSQLFNVQIAGEASLRNASALLSLKKTDSTWDTTTLGNYWFPRLCLSLTKFFPLAGVADRLTMNTEFYYNGAGNNVNIFNDPVLGRDIQQLIAGSITPQLASDLQAMPWLASATTLSNLYTPNSYSKYYAALFCSISQFLIDPMTFTCNAIGNLPQKSFVVSTGINYHSLNDFVFGVSLNAFLGPKNTEYTFSGNALMAQVTTGILF